MSQEKGVRDLIVTDLKELATGTDRNGKPYVLFQVRATQVDGRVIPDMKLRTFEQLPLNQPIKVKIDVHDSEKYGKSYTLFQVGGERKSAGEALTEKVDDLVKRVAHLEGLLGRTVDSPAGAATADAPVANSNIRAQPAIGPPMPDATPPPTPPTTEGSSNDDIPF